MASRREPTTHQVDKTLAVAADSLTDGNTYRIGPNADTTNSDLFSGGLVSSGSLYLGFPFGVSDADAALIAAVDVSVDGALTLGLTVDFHNSAGDVVRSFGAVTTPTTLDGEVPELVGLVPIPDDLEIGDADITVVDGSLDLDSLYICWVR